MGVGREFGKKEKMKLKYSPEAFVKDATYQIDLMLKRGTCMLAGLMLLSSSSFFSQVCLHPPG